ncbi:MAG: c-type cytochrome [Vicinamibacterales bacterium]
MQSKDVIHSFWIPRLHGKVDMIPGIVNRIRIQADTAGVYRGECAEYCGPQHAHMVLLVVAQTPDEYRTWVDAQARPAAEPPDAQAVEGRRVFLGRQCVVCHTIRGTEARGLVGPDLTHAGSRRGIAANLLPNDTASVSTWVAHAQSVKPYARMPDMTGLTASDVRAVAAYLLALQ